MECTDNTLAGNSFGLLVSSLYPVGIFFLTRVGSSKFGVTEKVLLFATKPRAVTHPKYAFLTMGPAGCSDFSIRMSEKEHNEAILKGTVAQVGDVLESLLHILLLLILLILILHILPLLRLFLLRILTSSYYSRNC